MNNDGLAPIAAIGIGTPVMTPIRRWASDLTASPSLPILWNHLATSLLGLGGINAVALCVVRISTGHVVLGRIATRADGIRTSSPLLASMPLESVTPGDPAVVRGIVDAATVEASAGGATIAFPLSLGVDVAGFLAVGAADRGFGRDDLFVFKDAARTIGAAAGTYAGSVDAIRAERRAVLTDVAAILAHDLQNALYPVRTFIEVLPSIRQLEASEAELHSVAAKNVGTLVAFFTQAVRCGAEPDEPPQRTAIAEIVRVACNGVAERAAARKVALLSHVGNEVLLSIPARCAFILERLLANAIDASPEKATVSISCRGSTKSGYFLFEVRDAGAGIPPAQQSSLFRPFFTTKRGKDGTPRGFGLSLAAAEMAADQLGGELWFETEPGVGSAFYFRVPASRQH